MTEEAHARGVSLWLMPEGRAREHLGQLIETLARRLGTRSFAPHVTLLPGLSLPEERVIEGARDLATALVPFVAGSAEVDGLDRYYQSLFLRLAEDPGLREAHAQASRRFGLEPNPFFDPHLSLVYGALDPEVRAGLVRELAGEARLSIEIRRLHVWRTEGPVGDWREVGAFALAGTERPDRA